MTEPETPKPDHREHAKLPPRPDDDALADLAEQEREDLHAGGPEDVGTEE